MIAFEISSNGRVLALVGAHDLIGLNAVLMACGDLNGSGEGVRVVSMSALGFAKGSRSNTTLHHTWNLVAPKGQFDVGDTVSIRIVRTEAPTPPATSEELENEDAEPDAAPNGGTTALDKSGARVPPSVT